MTDSEHTRLFWLIEQIPRAASAVVIVVGTLVLFGWVFDLTLLKSVFSGLVFMKVNTALGLILTGISLWNTSPSAHLPLSRVISQVCATIVLLLGLLTVSEYLSGMDFGIDQLVMPDITILPGDIPGRMAPNAAVSFSALGVALVLLNRKNGGFIRTIHVLAIVPILIAGVALVSYGYDIDGFLRAKLNYTPMAIHTAAAFILLGLGILNARADYPCRRIMSSDSTAGRTARRLWSAAMMLQLLMGWLLLKGFQAGYFNETVGLALFAVANMGGLSALIYWNETGIYQAETALRESEERYRTLFESIDEAFCIVEVLFDENEKPVDYRFLVVNPAFERQAGISDVVGRRMREIIPMHEEHWSEIYGKVALTGEPMRFESHAAQRQRDYDVYAFRIGAPAERKVAILFSDITEYRRVEENLRDASLYARSLIEASLDPLVTISADGKITDVNHATEDVTGLRRERLVGSDFSEYFTEPGQARDGYQMVFAQGFVKDYPLAIRHISGRITDVLYNARLYRNEKGEVGGVFAAARDITELKRNETALRESEEKFRAISNSAQDAILMMDNDGEITYWNPAAELIFGYPAELALGKSLHPLLAPERYLEDYRKGFAHFRTTGEGAAVGKTLELMAKRNSGEEFPIELSLSAIKLGDRWSAVGIVRDITKRKQAEEQLRHAHDQLELRIEERTLELAKANQALQVDIEARMHVEEELRKLNETLALRVTTEVAKNREKDLLMIQQSRMAAMGEMIGNIAHQWRQPLNALAIVLGDIKEASEFDELNDEYLENAIANGHRLIKKMSTTINDFRDFFRPDKERVPFSALAQIHEAISLVEASLKNNNIDLELIAPRDFRLLGFPNEYSQVLLNLLSNAKEAIQARNIAAGKVIVRLERVGDFGRVSVTDNGGGIPADILDKIFDPYFSTKEIGTGIGLYMSKMIIERNMTGRLFARNTDGGAEFVIDTPLVDDIVSPKAMEGE